MSTAPLDLKVAVIGMNKLDKLVKRMDVLEEEVKRLNKTLPRVSNNIRKMGTASAGAATQTSKFSKAVGGLAAAFASIQIGSGFAEAVKDARALELSGRRLKLLTAEYKQYIGVQAQAERLAKKFEVSVADSSKALFSLGSRLGAQGTTLDEIVSVYEGLNSALIVTGRSAQEAASANYQLSQALGSGKLTGDELRTIVETLPELLNEIANQAGKSASEIRQMAKDGELTTDVIIKATKALGEKYSKAVKDSITVNQKFNNSIQGVSEKIGKSLVPVLDPLQLALIDFFNAVTKLPDPIIAVGTAATAAAVGIGALQASLSLLGLPGIIGLLGKLATALAGVAGVTTSVVTGFTAAGAAVKATTLVVTAQTVALGALKVAMLAVPWVALAAGLTAVGVAAFNATKKIRTMRDVMNTNGGSVKELKNAMVTLENEIKRIEKKMEQGGNQARGYKRKIDELKKALEKVTGIYDIQVRLRAFLDTSGVDVESLDQGFYGPGGSAGVKDAQDLPTGGNEESNGSGSAPRASDAPQLRRDLKLAQDLFALNSQLVEAEINKNNLRIEGIRIEKIGLETRKEIADIKASDLYADEKTLEIQKLKVAESERLLEIEKEGAIAARDKAEAEAEGIRNALRPLEEQRRILEATLLGRGEEERLLIQIENILASTVGLEKEKVEELVRGNVALEEEISQAEKLNQVYGQIGKAVGDGLVKGITAAIDGTEDLNKVLADTLNQLSKVLFNLGLQLLGGGDKKGIFSLLSGNFGGAFADGGRLGAGQWGIAGEAGPEIISGPATITPMSGSGGSTVVNITVNSEGNGSRSTQGSSQEDATKLARLIESSTMAVINREKRAGGTLSR